MLFQELISWLLKPRLVPELEDTALDFGRLGEKILEQAEVLLGLRGELEQHWTAPRT